MATIAQALQLALQHHRAGRLESAEDLYRRILAAEPAHADALHLLGVIAQQRGQHAAAIERIGQAIALRGTDPAFHSNQGEAYRALERFSEAIACYRRAIELAPEYAEAHSNLGLALQHQGLVAEAIEHLRHAVHLRPEYAEAWYNLGIALHEAGQAAAAIDSYRQAVRLHPEYAAAHGNLGAALAAEGRFAEAVACYEQAIQLEPADAESHYNLGAAWQEQGDFELALRCYRRALELHPNLVAAHKGLGGVFRFQGRLAEAKACYRRALELNPDDAETHNNLATIFQDQGDLAAAVTGYRRAMQLRPDLAWIHSNYLATLQYRAEITPAELRDAHREYEQRHAAPLRAAWRTFDNRPDPERPLRVGFVSPHLSQHPVGYFLIRVLEHMDRQAFTAVCYSDRARNDALTDRFQAAAGEWRNVARLADDQLAELIRADGIDILFDLAGHTGGNRLLVFARKPAPIQITWLDYEGTTGLSAIDYLLADPYEIPPSAEAGCSEQVLRMPDDFVCYDPPSVAPAVGPLPALGSGRVTFASFNLPCKVTPRVVEVWSEILHRVPQSRLWLKYRGLDDPETAARYHRMFADHGIPSARVCLEGWSPYAEFLACYNQVDIALDPFPYTGGLTTCEALWMGVPVVTWAGETFAGCHGLTHLMNVGLTETIARSLPEYVELAVRLAGDLPRLASLRADLRQQVARSPLCDGKRFAEHLGQLLRGVWRQWCRAR
jgi:predicted O-linked N-acetylglucosamine transferase (SPINDLY family)